LFYLTGKFQGRGYYYISPVPSLSLAIIKQIFFDKNDYTLNEQIESFNAEGLIAEENSIVEKVTIKRKKISLYLVH
jgi:hypothetical protein